MLNYEECGRKRLLSILLCTPSVSLKRLREMRRKIREDKQEYELHNASTDGG
jgi:hypothetical protein